MDLRVRETGQLIDENQFRKINPNTSFPFELTDEILNEFGVDRIFEGEKPEITSPYQIVIQKGIEQIDGKWFKKYVIGPIFTDAENLTASEQEAEYRSGIDNQVAENVRAQRDELLQKTDWIVIKAKETETNISATFKDYRQALRDITQQEGFPHSVTWPEKP